MSISKMKPLAARWLVGAFDYLQDHEEFAVNGFKEADIFNVLSCKIYNCLYGTNIFRMKLLYEKYCKIA